MTTPSYVGAKVVDATGSAVTSLSFDPSSPTFGSAIATGHFMLLQVFGAAGAVMNTPSGWNPIDKRQQGTRHGGFFYRVRQAGDTTYSITIPSSNGAQGVITWFKDVDPALTALVVGAMFYRTASQATTPVAGVTSTVDGCLIVTAAVEASTATESDVSSATFGTKAFFAPQTTSPQIHTSYLNTYAQATAGASGTNTITYPNASANGFGVQLALPPAPSGNTAPTAAFDFVRTGTSVAFDDASVDLDGSIATRAWDFDDGGTATSADPVHVYSGAGSYDVQLTVTDDDGASDSVTRTVVVPSVLESSGGHTFYDAFARYSDGPGPVGKAALTGQTWELYSGPDEIVDGLYDSADLTAAYPYVVATDEVTKFGCKFRFDTHSGALTTTGSIILSVWDDITQPSTRKSRCHMILTPAAAQLTVYQTTSPTSLGSSSFTTSQDAWHTMEVVLAGTNAKLYVDGALRLNITDSLIADQGMRHVVWEPYYGGSATASRARIAEVWADWGAATPPALPLHLGSSQIAGAYIGSTPITGIYLGSTKLWP